jgi:excisionase family DNA binding protein
MRTFFSQWVPSRDSKTQKIFWEIFGAWRELFNTKLIQIQIGEHSTKTYTIEELQPILRLKKRAIRKIIAEGELPARMIGRQWLVREEDLKMALDPYLDASVLIPSEAYSALK